MEKQSPDETDKIYKCIISKSHFSYYITRRQLSKSRTKCSTTTSLYFNQNYTQLALTNLTIFYKKYPFDRSTSALIKQLQKAGHMFRALYLNQNYVAYPEASLHVIIMITSLLASSAAGDASCTVHFLRIGFCAVSYFCELTYRFVFTPIIGYNSLLGSATIACYVLFDAGKQHCLCFSLFCFTAL